MSGFQRTSSGVRATFPIENAHLLSHLANELTDLIEHRPARGSDTAIDRLFPDAYGDNETDAAEFRRFTEVDLADAKSRNAAVVVSDLSAHPGRRGILVELDDAGCQAWVRTLTDLRLTLGARLDVGRDGSLSPEADDGLVAVYEWLGYLQETLVQAIDV